MSADPVPPGPLSELILDHISTCVVTADQDRRATFANKVALDVLRARQAPVLGRDVVEVFGGNRELAAALAEIPIGGERRVDFFLPRAEGPPIEMGMTIVRARPDAPPALAFAFLFRDLLDARQMEIERRRAERLNVLGTIIEGLNHEIRNPLTGLQFLAEGLLGEMAEDDPRRGYAVRMQSLVGRIEGLIGSLLHFGELHPVEKRVVSAERLVELLRASVLRLGRGQPTFEAHAGLPPVAVDTDQMVECVVALVKNALDATGDAARVTVRLRMDETPGLVAGADRLLRIDVVDDGRGIPVERLALVCDPFYTTKPKATGLGLSVADALVRRNGGRMLVLSTPGVGSVFSLLLPASRESVTVAPGTDR